MPPKPERHIVARHAVLSDVRLVDLDSHRRQRPRAAGLQHCALIEGADFPAHRGKILAFARRRRCHRAPSQAREVG